MFAEFINAMYLAVYTSALSCRSVGLALTNCSTWRGVADDPQTATLSTLWSRIPLRVLFHHSAMRRAACCQPTFQQPRSTPWETSTPFNRLVRPFRLLHRSSPRNRLILSTQCLNGFLPNFAYDLPMNSSSRSGDTTEWARNNPHQLQPVGESRSDREQVRCPLQQ